MVLQSQSYNPQTGRLYMRSRRRSGSKWPWIALLGLIAAAVIYFGFLRDKARQAVKPTRWAIARVEPPPARQIKPVKVEQPHHQLEPHPQPSPQGATVAAAMELIQKDTLVSARNALNDLLEGSAGPLTRPQTKALRSQLMHVNNKLIFSKRFYPDDPLVEVYVVKPGDVLSRATAPYKIPYQLVEYINDVKAKRIRGGQRLKMAKGPFHAVVLKSQYRLDVYLTGDDGKRVYICSFPVGLGEDDSTPLGKWIVRPGSKQIDPGWTNPRTGEQFAGGDQRNPIGRYWLGLEGADEQTRPLSSYGIHGTIEPQTIGQLSSMGCIRLLPKDVKLLFYLLSEGDSTVVVNP